VFVVRRIDASTPHVFTIQARGYARLEWEVPASAAPTGEYEHTFELGKGGTLKGRVVEQGTWQPLAGVSVQHKGVLRYDFLAKGRATLCAAASGPDGTFCLEGLPEGKNYFDFRPAGCVNEQVYGFEITHGAQTNAGDVVVSSRALLKGALLKGADKQPVAGARIVLGDTRAAVAESETKTDAAGKFRFEIPPGERYGLTVSAPDFGVSARADLGKANETYVELHVGSATLKGRTLYHGQGEPASLTLYLGQDSRQARTDAQGRFEFAGLPPGMLSVQVHALSGRYHSLHEKLELSEGQTLEKQFEFRAGAIRGRVEDAGGKPLAGVRVTAVQILPPETPRYFHIEPFMCPEKLTGSDGLFGWEGLPGSSFTVRANRAGIGHAYASNVTVPEDGEAPEVVLRLGDGATLVSIATDEANGRGLAQAACQVWSNQGGFFEHGAVRGPDGRMEIPGIGEGEYRMTVSAPGYATVQHNVRLEAGKAFLLEDRLFAAGGFSWKLVSAQGETLRGVRCVVAPRGLAAAQEQRSGMTNGSGCFEMRDLRPGAYTATAYPAQKPPVVQEITVVAGATHSVTTRVE
jgi:hypothetical protein